jgi:glyoxylate utilization-related uncharacterized protein
LTLAVTTFAAPRASSPSNQSAKRPIGSAANGILYQISGSTEVSLDGESKMLGAGEGLFIPGGKTAMLKASSGESIAHCNGSQSTAPAYAFCK